MRVFVLLLVLLCGAHARTVNDTLTDLTEALADLAKDQEALSAAINRSLREQDAWLARAQATDREQTAELERLRRWLLHADLFLLRYALNKCDDAQEKYTFVWLCAGTEHATLFPAVFMTRGEWTRECLASFVRCHDDTGTLRQVLRNMRFEFDPWMRESEYLWPPQCVL